MKAWLLTNLAKILGGVILLLLVVVAVQTLRVERGKTAVATAGVDNAKLQSSLDKAQRDYKQSQVNQATLAESLHSCSDQLDAVAAWETQTDETRSKAALEIVATKPSLEKVTSGDAKEMNSWLSSLFSQSPSH